MEALERGVLGEEVLEIEQEAVVDLEAVDEQQRHAPATTDDVRRGLRGRKLGHRVVPGDAAGRATPRARTDARLVGVEGGAVREALGDLPHERVRGGGDGEGEAAGLGAGELHVPGQVPQDGLPLLGARAPQLPLEGDLTAHLRLRPRGAVGPAEDSPPLPRSHGPRSVRRTVRTPSQEES